MPNTIQLRLLDNKQIKIDMRGISLGSENSYRIISGEENSTQFEIISKPTQYAEYDFYVLFLNTKMQKCPLKDDEGESVVGEAGDLLYGNTFTLPLGMAVKGYGVMTIYAKNQDEKAVWQSQPLKIWETFEHYQDYVAKYIGLGDVFTPTNATVVNNTIVDTDTKKRLEEYLPIKYNNITYAFSSESIDNWQYGAVVDDTVYSLEISHSYAITAESYVISALLPNTTKYGANLSLTINNSTYVVTAQLKDQNGDNLGTAQTIDLPLESVVVSGSYNNLTKKVILTLQNGSTVEFSVADLVNGLQNEITLLNPLSADLVDDTYSTNKFIRASDLTNTTTDVDYILGRN